MKKILIFSMICVIALTLFGCNFDKDKVSINDNIIESILKNETDFKSVFLSIKKEANNIGLDIREIEFEFNGITNIQNKTGICTITLFKETNGFLNDFFYEGGKVEIETIVFSTANKKLKSNIAMFDHGKAVVVAGFQLKIEEWNSNIENLIDSFINDNFTKIIELDNPTLYANISNDSLLINLRNDKTVQFVMNYDLIVN